jgi:N6-adenosine-specific RNA methylase IME4
MTNSLVKLDQATRMLAEIRTVDDAKQLIDLAEAARVYARQVDLGLEAQNHAAEIKLRAQRRAGEVLQEMEKAKGQGERGEDGKFHQRLEAPTAGNEPPTYAEMGIEKHAAHNWQIIADMPEEDFEQHIAETKAEGKELTTAGTVRAIRKLMQERTAETPPLPTGKYRVLYGDPPWKYSNVMPEYFTEQADHYPLMSLDEICNMPIKDVAEDNAVLFLWVTSPILEDAFKVIRAWGFTYKASFVWDKVKHVMGHYNSVRHELLLVCTRGSCQPDVKKLYDSVVSIERTDHSEKPEFFREIIDTLYPNGARIELFARRQVNGWDCYGNEVSPLTE